MGKRINFDKNWRFKEADLPPQQSTEGWGGAKARAYSFGVTADDFDDSKWQLLDLPHDFVSDKEYCFKNEKSADMQDIPEMESIGSRLFAGGCLEGGVAWYRKHFNIDSECSDKRIYIHFDGVYRNSSVYINQYFVGTHASGYTSFYYDITDFVNIGGDNIISVRVDSREREGWWYEGGGIYRHVWLEITDSVHIAPMGLFASSEVDLENMSAKVNIQLEIENKLFEDTSVNAKITLKDVNGNNISDASVTADLKAWDSSLVSCTMYADNINLWDIDNPYLYTVTATLFRNGNICDECTVNHGIRHIRFDNNTGFHLNGRKLKIKGLCCHHDHAGVGIGVPDSVNEYRITQMKSMGTNAIRSSHYPSTPELLDICDKSGMLVFDETRRMSSAPEDLECLRSMIKRDRNHPSIFLWGIGNEEIFSQNRPETARTTCTMKAEVRKLDPTRPITSAVVCWDGTQRYDNAAMYVDITKHLDVMGFNYCMQAWDDYHERMPHQPMIITEATSSSGTRGCYSTDESKGFYYILDDDNINKCKNGQKALKKDTGEKMWKGFDERDYLAGIFLWTGIDYRGEPTPLTYPAVYSQFGIFDYCAFPKDNYYYYKSWWQDEDVLHIFPHWNHPAEAVGKPLTMHCYSNFDEVELFVNGKSYGRQPMQKNWYLTWDNVIYEPGEVSAKGYRSGVEIAEKKVCTTGEAHQIIAEAYKDTVHPGDTAIINIRIADKDFVTVPTANNKLYFEVEGCGSFIGSGNGNPGDHDNENVPVRCAFNGLCQLLVSSDRIGDIKITVKSDNLTSGECKITVTE